MQPVITLVCGDPGGANAVAPVIERLRGENRVRVQPLAYRQACASWSKRNLRFIELDETTSHDHIVSLLRNQDTALLITGTSFNDVNLENRFIACGREIGLPSLAVLDFWSNYALRFSDGKGSLLCIPDRIAVMDERARDEMLGEGFPASRLAITGQPAFDDLAPARSRFTPARRQEIREALGVGPGEQLVLFASQPFSVVYGTDTADRLYPGFTEQAILNALVLALDEISGEHQEPLVLLIRPHPREDATWLRSLSSRRIRVLVSKDYDPREVVMSADLVAGVNTALLVEACYLGCVTVSLQPGLRGRDPVPTNAWGVSQGVYSFEEIKSTVDEMLFDLVRREAVKSRLTRLKLDGEATRRVVRLAYQMIGLGTVEIEDRDGKAGD